MEISALDGSGDIVIDEPWQEVTKWPQGRKKNWKKSAEFILAYIHTVEANRNDTQRDIWFFFFSAYKTE